MKITYGGGNFDMPFYFNVTGSVGRGYPNARRDDVLLVQFIFTVIAASASLTVPPNLQTPWSKVKLTGTTDQATLDSIDAWQQDRRTRFGRQIEVDGIVSVAPAGLGDYSKDAVYTIVALNYLLMLAAPSLWPRLDKHQLATPELCTVLRTSISKNLTA